MKKAFVIIAASLAIAACCYNTPKGIVIERQGVFSSGGTVTAPIPGDYDPTQNWMDATRKGTTTHVDHANTFYQIPEGGNGTPIVFLHGYGQTRTGWQATPDGRVGWATDVENIAAVVAVEPGFGPMVGSPEYQKFLDAKVPMLFLFGDYIMNGPADIQSTGFWQMVLGQCKDFAEHYNADGGNAKVVYLPDEGITGNSHFMFQELNNGVIADYIENWLKQINL